MWKYVYTTSNKPQYSTGLLWINFFWFKSVWNCPCKSNLHKKKNVGEGKKEKIGFKQWTHFFNTHRDFYFFSLNSLRCYYFKFRKENRCQYVISLKITSPLCMAISLFYSPHSSHFSLVDRYYSLFPFLSRLHVLIHLLNILCRCLNFFLNTVCLLGFSQTAISDSLCMVYS